MAILNNPSPPGGGGDALQSGGIDAASPGGLVLSGCLSDGHLGDQRHADARVDHLHQRGQGARIQPLARAMRFIGVAPPTGVPYLSPLGGGARASEGATRHGALQR